MSPVGAIFVPFPPKTGTNMLHPLPQSPNLSNGNKIYDHHDGILLVLLLLYCCLLPCIETAHDRTGKIYNHHLGILLVLLYTIQLSFYSL